jgi:hypothetical protein
MAVVVLVLLIVVALGLACVALLSSNDKGDAAVTDEQDLADTLGIAVTDIKTAYYDDPDIICVQGNLISDLREIGGLALRYEHAYTGSSMDTRVNIVVKDGDAANAFIFATDTAFTYELVATGFFGVKTGGDPAVLTPATSLTFFATEAGTYVIDFILTDVVTDEKLDTMTFTIVVK